MADKLWLTVQQAADRVQMSKATIYAAVNSKALASVRVGSAIRIHVDWVDAWMQRCSTVRATLVG